MVATSKKYKHPIQIIPLDKDNVKEGGGYSDDIKIFKPTKQPENKSIIPTLNPRITEDKLKKFVNFKF